MRKPEITEPTIDAIRDLFRSTNDAISNEIEAKAPQRDADVLSHLAKTALTLLTRREIKKVADSETKHFIKNIEKRPSRNAFDPQEFHVETEPLQNKALIMHVVGEIDIHSAPKFKELLIGQIDEGATNIAIDLEETVYIDSTALGVLVSAAKKLRDVGNISIFCDDENVKRIFEITGLDRIFRVADVSELEQFRQQED